MEWVNTAEEYCGRFGWGARGKYIGISRMMNDNDKSALSQGTLVAAIRPRGILSGFLAIVPKLEYAVFLPPIAAKIGPQRIRMRLSETVKEKGAIFSSYMTRDKTMVLEDILVWQEKSVWFTEPFKQRWNNTINSFVTEHWKEDSLLQGLSMTLATYMPLATIQEPEQGSVIEFIPNQPNQKRMIWIGSQTTQRSPQVTPTNTGTNTSTSPNTNKTDIKFTVKKEAGMGPDVYAIFKNDERMGVALVRTLVVSRALRAAVADKAEMIAVSAVHNKQFDKYEIVSVL